MRGVLHRSIVARAAMHAPAIGTTAFPSEVAPRQISPLWNRCRLLGVFSEAQSAQAAHRAPPICVLQSDVAGAVASTRTGGLGWASIRNLQDRRVDGSAPARMAKCRVERFLGAEQRILGICRTPGPKLGWGMKALPNLDLPGRNCREFELLWQLFRQRQNRPNE